MGFQAGRHERLQPWLSWGWRLFMCAMLISAVLTGASGLTVGLGFLFLVTGLPSLAGWIHFQMRRAALRDVEGRFYEFKGVALKVEEDDSRRMRWLRVDDLARALGTSIKASALRQRHADGTREIHDELYISDEAALAYLATCQTERSARLRVWVEREVWYPARHRHGGRI